MFDYSAFIQILSIVLTAATTIIVAVVQVRASKKEKENKETQRLQAEINKQKEDTRHAAEIRQEKQLESVAKSVNKIEEEITGIKQDQEVMKQQLDRVVQVSLFNVQFSNEINTALGVLSDSIIDQTADETLRKSMQEHRKRTAELQTSLYETTL